MSRKNREPERERERERQREREEKEKKRNALAPMFALVCKKGLSLDELDAEEARDSNPPLQALSGTFVG